MKKKNCKFVDYGAQEVDENDNVVKTNDDEESDEETKSDQEIINDEPEISYWAPTPDQIEDEEGDMDEERQNMAWNKQDEEDRQRTAKAKSRTRVQAAESSSSSEDEFVVPDSNEKPVAEEHFSEESMSPLDIANEILDTDRPHCVYSPSAVPPDDMYCWSSEEPIVKAPACAANNSVQASWDFMKKPAPTIKAAKKGQSCVIRGQDGVQYYQDANGKRIRMTERS
jgi:hypothetical protein